MRYWVAAHVPIVGAPHMGRKETFPWRGFGFVPGVTGKATASVVCALVDAPGVLEVEQALRDRFGNSINVVFASPKPDDWTPPDMSFPQ